MMCLFASQPVVGSLCATGYSPEYLIGWRLDSYASRPIALWLLLVL